MQLRPSIYFYLQGVFLAAAAGLALCNAHLHCFNINITVAMRTAQSENTVDVVDVYSSGHPSVIGVKVIMLIIKDK